MDVTDFAQRRRALSERLTNGLRDAFTGLDTWRDADAQRFAAYADPTVRGAQSTLAGLVSTYIAADAGGDTLAPPPIPAAAVTGLRGVSGRSVYLRPFVALWNALAQGKTLQRSIGVGATRLVEIAELDMQQAHSRAVREAYRRIPEQRQPRLWRRVLVGDKNCALCIVASTHRYTIDDLNPIHPHCDCTVAGIYGIDATRDADDALLEQVHKAVAELVGTDTDRGGRRTVDYRQVHITREHGELGPMLARPSDKFTSVDELTGVAYKPRRRRRTRA